MDITRWSILKSDWLYFLQPQMEKLHTVSKNKTRSWLWLRSWTPYCKIQTWMEENGKKITRPLRFPFNSVKFSHSEVSDSLWPHGLQHARLPCPLPTPRVYSNSCPLIQWWHPSHPLSSPSPPTFNLSQHQGLFYWVSSLHQVAKVLEFQLQHRVLPMNIQDWFPLVWPKSNPLWLFSGSDK